jgi:hypothetical protein
MTQQKMTWKNPPSDHQQVPEKAPAYRLLKNVQIQGSRNPEERGVLASTSQQLALLNRLRRLAEREFNRARMRGTPETGVFQQPARAKILKD